MQTENTDRISQTVPVLGAFEPFGLKLYRIWH